MPLNNEILYRRELEVLKNIDLFWPLRPTVNILIVTDGSGAFDSISDFGLGKVITELQNDPWWWVRFVVTTAHRRSNSQAATAMHQNFRFDAPPDGINLNNFDQIWLFGVEGLWGVPLLQPEEITALTNFMNSGRGVFATGDHEDLGASLCADLPRINKMRQWRTGGPAGTPPPVGGVGRHDTSRQGLTPGYQFNDQSDNVPQPIIPKPYYDPWGHFGFYRRWRPHPVLCGRNGILDVLPDHMHEGHIVVPSAGDIVANPSEWPSGVGPEIIADATVIAHTNTDGHGYVSGKQFGVLGAYNGHPYGVGRIVVDATWHHWFNINLIGFDTSSSNYDKIRNYFWNVALWLSPPELQTAMFNAAVYGLTWLQPFNEFSKKFDLIYLGFSGVDAIGRRASQCVATEWIIIHLPPLLQEEFRYKPIPPNPPDPAPFRGLEFAREFALGGVLSELLNAVGPENRPEKPPSLREIGKLTQIGIQKGLTNLIKSEYQEIENSQRLLNIVQKSLRDQ